MPEYRSKPTAVRLTLCGNSTVGNLTRATDLRQMMRIDFRVLQIFIVKLAADISGKYS